jgi:ParB family chromosome partitioning protein
MGHARALINIDNPAGQLSVFDKILDDSLSVRDTEGIAKAAKSSFPKAKNKNKNFEDSKLEKELSVALDTKVKLSRVGPNKGKLIISFNSEEALREIIKSFHS